LKDFKKRFLKDFERSDPKKIGSFCGRPTASKSSKNHNENLSTIKILKDFKKDF